MMMQQDEHHFFPGKKTRSLFNFFVVCLQEQLLLSVLPRFVALEIISDIANQDQSRILPTQFHKIYIHCYKDVR